MNITLYTLSFDFQQDYKVVVGYRILGMKSNELLGSAFTYDGEWSLHKYHLGEFTHTIENPEVEVLHIFNKFLETIRIHFSGDNKHFRRENGLWVMKKNINHETSPSQIELDELDRKGYAKKMDFITKISNL